MIERRLSGVAIHEAGHAAVAVLLNVGLRGVDIQYGRWFEDGPPQPDDWGDNLVREKDGSAMLICPDSRAGRHDYGIACLAGPLAQRQYEAAVLDWPPDLYRFGGRSDVLVARAVYHELDADFDRAVGDAEEFVSDPGVFAAIKRVAEGFRRSLTLTPEQVRAAIDGREAR
jgi:hypothetical protein